MKYNDFFIIIGPSNFRNMAYEQHAYKRTNEE